MSSRYSLQEFKDASLTPGNCDRIISAENGNETMYMACDYHEGYIDGYERGSLDNR
jgi:hypothetical protein